MYEYRCLDCEVALDMDTERCESCAEQLKRAQDRKAKEIIDKILAERTNNA